MARTVIIFALFIIGITLNIIWVPFVLILRLFRLRKIDRWAGKIITGHQARIYIKMIGVRVEVFGKENCAGLDGLPLCVIANHQGILDIPVVAGWIPFPCGFIAKQELSLLPMFFVMMWYLRCVLINRKSPRSAVRAIDRGVKNIRRGYPMLIFPEGTRSKGPNMSQFKPGSLKLATRAEATILPITINRTYKALEECGVAAPAHVSIIIHKSVSTKGLSKEELKELPGILQNIIQSGLEA